MSATASPAIKPASPTPPRAAAAPAASSGEHAFDRRLDAARQQHQHERSTAADDNTAKPAAAKPAADAKDAATPAKAAAVTKDPADATSDAAALAAAMLALLGQSAPATAPVAPLPGSPAAAAGSRGALAALTPTGKPKAADTALGALLGAGSAAEAPAAPTTPAPVTSAAELLPVIAASKDDHASALPDLAAQAAALHAAASGNPASVPVTHQLNVASTVGTPAFTQDLGQQITWLGNQELKQARIKLHPEDLGALDVKISMHHDRVDLTFIAQHPATVHAVQQSLAHLDAMLAQQGMTLGHADVSQQQQRGEGNGQGGGSSSGFGEIEEPGLAAMAPVSSLAPTLLDMFA